MKITPALRVYVNNFYTEFHENLSLRHRRTGARMDLVSTFFILLRKEGLTNYTYVLTDGAIQRSQGPCCITEKIICTP